MWKREKNAKARENSSSEEDRRKRKPPVEEVASDDEANEDLSLKIVQKAMRRALRDDPRDDGVSEIVMDLKAAEKKKREKRKRKRKKTKGIETPEVSVSSDIDTDFRVFCGDLVDNVMGEDNVRNESNVKDGEKPRQTDKAFEISDKEVETSPVEASDNAVLRKLLRGPRYFDPPDSNWGACYNCGEEGHTIANCTSAKRKKPCFVCGSFEHNAKQCSKGHDCFICKQHGHRAKECPGNNKNSTICLKCGDLGHEMFSCRNDYSRDDLKDIQCYICGKFGHLCCIDYNDTGPTEVSCYRCGLSGHTGLACMGSHWDTRFELNSASGSSSCYKCGLEGHFARECSSSVKECMGGSHWGTQFELNSANGSSSCYKCGLEGHFARECSSSVKRNHHQAVERDLEVSTPKQRSSKKKKESHSEPHIRKKHKPQFVENASATKTKHRRGWTTEHPEDHYHSHTKASANNWRSPGSSSHNRDKYIASYGDYASNSHSFERNRKIKFHNSPANGSSRSHQNRYAASRFGYYNDNAIRGRNNDWW